MRNDSLPWYPDWKYWLHLASLATGFSFQAEAVGAYPKRWLFQMNSALRWRS